MMEPWFAPESARMFAFLSLLALTAALDPIARQGRARAAVLSVFAAGTALGVIVFVAGIVAALSGQPSFVMRTLLGSGLVVTIPLAGAFLQIQRVYREFELRKTIANDL